MSLPFDADTIFDSIVEQTNGVPTQAGYELAFDLVMNQGVDYPDAVQRLVNADYVVVGDKDRIDEAISIAVTQGQLPGEDHKTWVIDQMMRTLAAGEYRGVVDAYNTPLNAEDALESEERDDDEEEDGPADPDSDDQPVVLEEDVVVVEQPARHWDCGERFGGTTIDQVAATLSNVTVTRF